jgi:N-acyl-D-aspartate/D-glutamate deacylase
MRLGFGRLVAEVRARHGPGPARLLFLPPAERLAILRDPDRRRELRASAEEPSDYRHLVNWPTRHIIETFTPETARYADRTVGDIAADEGRDPFDVLMDIAVADDLRTTFRNPWSTPTAEDWRARAAIWRDPRAMIGASDAGAHLDMLEFFGYSTMLLQHGVREQQVITREEAVHMLTGEPAGLYGLTDRGVLRPGATADVTLFDAASIARAPVETRFDLPGGAGRLYGEAEGISHVIVNGVPIVEGSKFTGEFPGRIVRSGRDTRTAA